MKGYFESRFTQDITLSKGESYDIAYAYDETGRIVKETVTGSMCRTVDYDYDANDNIVTETISIDDKIITKTYTYDSANNITNVTTIVV